MKFETLHNSIDKGSQDVTLSEIGKAGARRYRISIKSDSYRSQCHAHIDVWSPDVLKWNRVADIAPASMKTRDGLSHGQRVATHADFSTDRAELLRLLGLVLS